MRPHAIASRFGNKRLRTSCVESALTRTRSRRAFAGELRPPTPPQTPQNSPPPRHLSCYNSPMHCPFCLTPKTIVRDSVSSHPSSSSSSSNPSPTTRRKRICATCSASFTTIEKIEQTAPDLLILKRNQSQQPLIPEKINNTLSLALAQKTTPKITTEITEKICQNLQAHARQNKTKTIPSTFVASQISSLLKKQNFAAYLRFSSAQQNLNSIQEIQELIASEKATQTHQKK